jgi:hypothetical protein
VATFADISGGVLQTDSLVGGNSMKKFIIAAVFAVSLASSAYAAASVSDVCPGVNTIPGQTGCNFVFWDGEGTQVAYTPTKVHFVTSASGNQTQVLQGVGIYNGTDAPIVYSAFSGGPIPAGQSCWNFQTVGSVTTNWQMVIDVDGNWTLTCNFKK